VHQRYDDPLAVGENDVPAHEIRSSSIADNPGGRSGSHWRPVRHVAVNSLAIYRIPVYDKIVIRSFRDAEAARVFGQQSSRQFGSIEKTALRKLIHLNRATSLRDLAAIPGNRLEGLKGARKGQHSIRVNDQYRICFVWKDGDAYDVEIADYH
jgi:proteic killer suppression protein